MTSNKKHRRSRQKSHTETFQQMNQESYQIPRNLDLEKENIQIYLTTVNTPNNQLIGSEFNSIKNSFGAGQSYIPKTQRNLALPIKCVQHKMILGNKLLNTQKMSVTSSYERFNAEHMKKSCFTSTQNMNFKEIIDQARTSENNYSYSPISSCMK